VLRRQLGEKKNEETARKFKRLGKKKKTTCLPKRVGVK